MVLAAPIGPRMRTVLLSMGCALAAIIGITDTVFVFRLTTLEAARLKSRLRRVALLAAMLIALDGIEQQCERHLTQGLTVRPHRRQLHSLGCAVVVDDLRRL